MSREAITTALDVLGLLLVAAGAGGGLYEFVGLWALAVSGAVVLAGSWLTAWLARPRSSASRPRPARRPWWVRTLIWFGLPYRGVEGGAGT